MIIDLILNMLSGVLSLLLAPLEIINFSVDFVSSISVVSNFLKVVAYLMPWSSFVPLIIFVIGITSFKLIIATITAIWDLIPFVR